MSGRADASTSTDDVKGRPLCLFYFTHPFGVLSPEPPLMSPVPPHLARAFDMEPGSMWSSSTSQGYDTTSTRPSFDLGNATVHRNPIQLVRNYGFDHRRESVSSSFFSSDVWFGSSSSSHKYDERRVIPYNRILPPLRLPSPRDLLLDLDSSDDVWPKKCFHPGKFSLPPIEMPVSSVTCSDDLFGEKVLVSESESVKRHKRVFGVKKHKRRSRVGSVRRMITRLMQRTVKKNCPAVENFCLCLPLKAGLIYISILGLICAGAFLYLFTSEGSEELEKNGLPKTYTKPLRYLCGLLGVLLIAVNVLLLIAYKLEMDALCEVYIWFTIVIWALLIAATFVLICGSVIAGSDQFAMVLGAVVLCVVLVSVYCLIVVANYRMTLP